MKKVDRQDNALPWVPIHGSHEFGAEVSFTVPAILAAPDRWLRPLQVAFDEHSLLYWRDAELSPAQEVAFMKLFDWDRSALPELLYGPLGKPGVDAEILRRWRIPSQMEVLLQGRCPAVEVVFYGTSQNFERRVSYPGGT